MTGSDSALPRFWRYSSPSAARPGATTRSRPRRRSPAPDGLTLTVRMQGPYDADVPLQVVCYFKPKAGGDTLKGAPVELDKRLGGVIANLRDRGEFAGDELETLVIDTGGMIPAKQLLLIGLGDEQSSPWSGWSGSGGWPTARRRGSGPRRSPSPRCSATRATTSCRPATWRRFVVRGLLLARDTDARLQKEGLAKKFALEEWVEEAGPDFYKETIAGVKTGIDEAKSAIGKRKATPFVNTGK